MKFGMRKPSLKRSIKARTTGRAKRAVKRALIPGYGKKGTGWIKDPRRAAYNKVYRKTTFGVGDIARAASKTKARPSRGGRSSSVSGTASNSGPNPTSGTLVGSVTTVGRANVTLALCVLLGLFGVHRFYAKKYLSGIVYLCTFGLFGLGWLYDILTLIGRRSELVKRGAVDLTDDNGRDKTTAKVKEGPRRDDDARELEQRRNRDFMIDAGIDVDSFTPTKAITDSMDVINRCVPSMLAFDHGLKKSEPSIYVCSPTNTGKVPKNVVEAHVRYEETVEVPVGIDGLTATEFGDSLSVSLSYLSSGQVNKADVIGWHRRRGLKVTIRRRGDELKVTGAQECDSTSAGYWQGICQSPSPTSDEIVRSVDAAVKCIFR